VSSYTTVQDGKYSATPAGPDAAGGAAAGSAAISSNFPLFGDFSQQDLDGPGNIDFDQWRAGIGYNHALSPNMDLLSRVAYEKFDAGGGLDSDGYSVEAGLRGAMTPQFEGYALAGYEDGDDYDGEFYGRLGAQVKFSPRWGVAADVKFVEDDTQWFVGPRLTW